MRFCLFDRLSVCRNSKSIAQIDLIFYARSIIPVARSSKMIRNSLRYDENVCYDVRYAS